MKFSSFLLSLALLLFGTSVAAQANHYTNASQSDKEAKRILESIRQKYDGYATLTADFRLELAFPNQPVEVQRGSLSRKGDLVRFKLGSQEGIINKDAAYFILHNSKEVQINDLPQPGETTGMLTPQNLFNFYEGEEYVLSLQGEETVDGRKLQIIEMKPVDRNASDFTKLRLMADQQRKEIMSVKAFSRDGSSYTFFLDNTRGNTALADNNFTFDKSQFPGYHVEDLRF
ncbi:LolA family protein [Neolewinella litorea]|uniref:Outer membrane lipoprotein carrier protein LolA n=1 Tax=Neolewinella litorea TaxID=2562452 RepID=A0A4S4NLV1_9BACT|nr:outer membrane lipoprotein carrier protein LolA [Neolewinella litorea]THH39331.1 outer membrane lipoprotein carrier protein LolA [Neolewinella litorea]